MSDIWEYKLQGFFHDPPEKAVILFRRAHEQGSVRNVLQTLGLPDEQEFVRKADRMASAADRMDLPPELWHFRTDFLENPIIKHPLSNQEYDLKSLVELGDQENLDKLEKETTDFFTRLIERGENGEIDYKKTFLKFWRFGPRPWDANEKLYLGRLFGVLPADTRIPDHTIWDHVNLTSALAGILGMGKQPALLRFALGPVQGFIAQARKTADLWAGSHLLSMLTFQAITAVIDEFGPDSVIFPNLNGLAIVDLWIAQQLGSADAFSDNVLWKTRNSDANPLWIAALPNVFTAVVPLDQAHEIAEKARARVMDFFRENAVAAAKKMFGMNDLPSTMMDQVLAQTKDFLEVFYAIVPWTDGQDDKYGDQANAVGNDLAATKNLRKFNGLQQEGYRCSVCGEREWLRDDKDLLNRHNPQGTVWDKVDKKKYAKKDEKLCALCTLKRVWPELAKKDFTDQMKNLDLDIVLDDYMVSTHTMAMAPTLEKMDKKLVEQPDLEQELELVKAFDRTAMPAKLVDMAFYDILSKLPDALDGLEDLDDQSKFRALRRSVKEISGVKPEKYYALILMDGDGMGKWMDGQNRKNFYAAAHPKLRENQIFLDKHPKDEDKRDPSPAYHAAISGILNDFSSMVAPRVVERAFKGKVIYAGGDDLMAFVSVDDVLDTMLALRLAFAGQKPPEELDKKLEETGLELGGGFAKINGKLYRMMGQDATASMGVVIAHYSTPLSVVLKTARQAEHRAKTLKVKGKDRDGFCITVLKRSGGAETFTAKWNLEEIDKGLDSPLISAMKALQHAVHDGALSRRFAFHLRGILHDLGGVEDAIAPALAYQIERQKSGKMQLKFDPKTLSDTLVHGVKTSAMAKVDKLPERVLDLVMVAEFLSREGRS